MRVFFWLAAVVFAVLAIFAVQNSTAPPVEVRFLLWSFQTSLVYTVLGSLAGGMIVILLLWIPFAFRHSSRERDLRKEIEIMERERGHETEASRQRGKGTGPV